MQVLDLLYCARHKPRSYVTALLEYFAARAPLLRHLKFRCDSYSRGTAGLVSHSAADGCSAAVLAKLRYLETLDLDVSGNTIILASSKPLAALTRLRSLKMTCHTVDVGKLPASLLQLDVFLARVTDSLLPVGPELEARQQQQVQLWRAQAAQLRAQAGMLQRMSDSTGMLVGDTAAVAWEQHELWYEGGPVLAKPSSDLPLGPCMMCKHQQQHQSSEEEQDYGYYTDGGGWEEDSNDGAPPGWRAAGGATKQCTSRLDAQDMHAFEDLEEAGLNEHLQESGDVLAAAKKLARHQWVYMQRLLSLAGSCEARAEALQQQVAARAAANREPPAYAQIRVLSLHSLKHSGAVHALHMMSPALQHMRQLSMTPRPTSSSCSADWHDPDWLHYQGTLMPRDARHQQQYDEQEAISCVAGYSQLQRLVLARPWEGLQGLGPLVQLQGLKFTDHLNAAAVERLADDASQLPSGLQRLEVALVAGAYRDEQADEQARASVQRLETALADAGHGCQLVLQRDKEE